MKIHDDTDTYCTDAPIVIPPIDALTNTSTNNNGGDDDDDEDDPSSAWSAFLQASKKREANIARIEEDLNEIAQVTKDVVIPKRQKTVNRGKNNLFIICNQLNAVNINVLIVPPGHNQRKRDVQSVSDAPTEENGKQEEKEGGDGEEEGEAEEQGAVTTTVPLSLEEMLKELEVHFTIIISYTSFFLIVHIGD